MWHLFSILTEKPEGTWVSVDGSDRRVVTTGRFYKEKRGYLEMPVFIKE